MQLYRVVWTTSCAALAVLGVLAGLAISPSATASVAISGAIVGAVVTFAVWCNIDPDNERRWWTSTITGAALISVSAIAALGLSEVLGASFFALAACVGLTAPPLMSRYRRWFDSASRPSAEQFEAAMTAAAWAAPGYVPVEATTQPRLMTDEELCRRWRRSCADLAARSPAIRTNEMEERQFLLEEIERRNPAGYLVWMITDAAAPESLLTRLTATPASAGQLDWDALLP